jgi:hypothetical protein
MMIVAGGYGLYYGSPCFRAAMNELIRQLAAVERILIPDTKPVQTIRRRQAFFEHERSLFKKELAVANYFYVARERCCL